MKIPDNVLEKTMKSGILRFQNQVAWARQIFSLGGLRVQQGSDIFRIFCFFDQGQLMVLANGFQKKLQKTPKGEIDKALKIKKEV